MAALWVDIYMWPRIHDQKIESFERINSIRETNVNFGSCNSCKRLVPSRLHELHETKLRLFHVSNLSGRNFRIFLLIYPGPVCEYSHRCVCGGGGCIFVGGLSPARWYQLQSFGGVTTCPMTPLPDHVVVITGAVNAINSKWTRDGTEPTRQSWATF